MGISTGGGGGLAKVLAHKLYCISARNSSCFLAVIAVCFLINFDSQKLHKLLNPKEHPVLASDEGNSIPSSIGPSAGKHFKDLQVSK